MPAKRSIAFLSLLVLCLTYSDALAANPAVKAEASNHAGAKAYQYKQIGDVKLSLHIFSPKSHKPSDKTPAIVFFFGGGWNGGTTSQFATHCQYLASRGMVAAVADYRVKSRHKTSPFECVMDGKSAVRWLRANADKLGIDPNRIAAGGGSAGGHVAAATGTVPGLEQTYAKGETGEDKTISCKPNALADRKSVV